MKRVLNQRTNELVQRHIKVVLTWGAFFVTEQLFSWKFYENKIESLTLGPYSIVGDCPCEKELLSHVISFSVHTKSGIVRLGGAHAHFQGSFRCSRRLSDKSHCSQDSYDANHYRPSPIADMQGNCFNQNPERYNEQEGASTPDFNGLLPIGFCYVLMYTVLPSRPWHGRKLFIGLWLLSKFASKCEISTRRRGATPKLSNRKSEKCTALKGSGRLTVLLSFSLVPKTGIRTTDLNDGDTFRG